MIDYSLLIADFLQQNVENRLVNKVFMIDCMTCSWAPTTGGTTAQSGQRNDGATAPTRSRSTTDSITSTEHCMQTFRNPQHSKKHFIIYTN